MSLCSALAGSSFLFLLAADGSGSGWLRTLLRQKLAEFLRLYVVWIY